MRSLSGVALAHTLTFVIVTTLVACPADDGDTGTPDDTGADGAEMCPDGDFGMGTDGQTNDVMQTWGSPCETNEDCVAVLGEGATCEDMAVIYELPGGYCTKPCSLPDANTRVVEDAMDCDPAGGVACIGQMGFFENCAVLCTDDAQCSRDGYFCRQMPMISAEGDPKACLMPDCCEGTCEGE